MPRKAHIPAESTSGDAESNPLAKSWSPDVGIARWIAYNRIDALFI
jgi:hypothetical protein